MLGDYRNFVSSTIDDVEPASIGIAKGVIIVWNLAGKATPATAFEFGPKRTFVLLRYRSI
jgi:hypothetical protein